MQNSAMKSAKLFSIIVIALTGIYAAIGLYCLPLAGFEGDLTRISKLPESLFGWNKTQPAIKPELFRSASWQDADILVIGDSFSSETKAWQTVLIQHGLRVRTEQWNSMRGVLCDDLSDWVRKQGFKGSHIIFEIIERNVEALVTDSASCKQQVFHPDVHSDKPYAPPITNRKTVDRSGKMSVGIDAWFNSRDYLSLSSQPDFKKWRAPSGITIEHLSNGCELFSHAKCQDVLFLAQDKEADLGEDVINQIEILNAKAGNFSTLWVFVPNKSTTYLYPDKQFWNKAEQRLPAPNVLKTMRQALANQTVDLYPANNSHVSTTGYLLLGDLIYQSLLPTLPANQGAKK